jgi:hypothetical protein
VTTVYASHLAEKALLPTVNEEKKLSLFHHYGIKLTEGLEANCQEIHALAMYERRRLLHYPVALQMDKNPPYTM